MTRREPIQTAALLVGTVFVLVGVAGFIPGLTTNYDELGLANHDGATLLGLFGVNVLHNVAHLVLGIAGISLAKTAATARTYLIGGGVVYFVLFLYGLLVDHDSAANFAALNSADNILHLFLALAMVGLGLALGERRRHAVTA